MSKVNFKQADLERGLRAAKASGLPVSCIQIDTDGKTQIIIGEPLAARTLAKANDSEFNEWDED